MTSVASSPACNSATEDSISDSSEEGNGRWELDHVSPRNESSRILALPVRRQRHQPL
jgi:hypothetical protein